MGGFGSVMAGIQAMRNNRAMLGKRKKGEVSLASSKNEKWVDPKQATPEQLLEIRTRIQKEEKANRKKTILITLVVIILVLGIGYIINL